VERQGDGVVDHHVGGQVALALALLAGVGQDMPHLIERKRLGDHAQADVVAEADAGRQAGGSTGHGCCSPNRGRQHRPAACLCEQHWG
jgi:hypothetical protein